MTSKDITELIRERQKRFRDQLIAFGFSSLVQAANAGRWYNREELKPIERDVLLDEIQLRLNRGPQYYREKATKAEARGEQDLAFAYREEATEIETFQKSSAG